MEGITIETSNKINWSFLNNVYDNNQAAIIRSILEDEGIPVLEKRRGAGAYVEIVAGISNTGIDLYVPDTSLVEAREILIAFEDRNITPPFEQDIPEGETDFAQRKKLGQGLVTILFTIPALTAFVYYVWDTIKNVVSSLFQ